MESPIPRRLSTSISIPIAGGSNRMHDIENVINSYEAEEERIVNVLSRKLEQLRDEKIQLENILEAESEAHVNRLSRELSALRMAQPAVIPGGQDPDSMNQSLASSPVSHFNPHINDPRYPSTDIIIAALRKENEILRAHVVEAEREFLKANRLNDIYREEIVELRRRLGLPVDNLFINPAAMDPFSQPTHLRRDSSSSPVVPTNTLPQRPSPGPLPIPRPPSQIHRPAGSEAPLAMASVPTSASSPESSTPASPFPFSPLSSSLQSPSMTGYQTTLTTPASVPPLTHVPPTAGNVNQLTYPHVPPPSLSSSVGSPVAMFSPVNATSRRNSRVAETGSLARRGSRGSSVDRHSRPLPSVYPSNPGPVIAEQLSEALAS